MGPAPRPQSQRRDPKLALRGPGRLSALSLPQDAGFGALRGRDGGAATAARRARRGADAAREVADPDCGDEGVGAYWAGRGVGVGARNGLADVVAAGAEAEASLEEGGEDGDDVAGIPRAECGVAG